MSRLSDIARVVSALPDLVTNVIGFAIWSVDQVWTNADDEDEDMPPLVIPLAPSEAARVALEMVTATKVSHKDAASYRPMMAAALGDIEHPQHLTDIALSLAGMAAVLADEKDLIRFGSMILHHEGTP